MFSGRSGQEWLIRGLFGIAILAAATVGTMSSLAQVLKRIDPARAHVLDSANGVVSAALAETTFAAQPDPSVDSPSARLARAALTSEPTAVEALTVLGFQAELRGDRSDRNRIFNYATALSRRELRPQIWAIEEAVTRGDIAGALRHYDMALRTSDEAQDLLFPTLTSALAEPRVRAELLEVLADKPRWTLPFVTYAAANSAEPLGTIRFFRDGQRIGLPVSAEMQVGLVNTLVAQGRFHDAWDYYASFRKGARSDRSRDPDFSLSGDARAAFDWVPGTEPGISATFLGLASGGVLDFALAPGAGGTLARQTQMLPPGDYALTGRSAGVAQSGSSLPFWTLVCLDGREISRVSLRNSDDASRTFAGNFTVPQDCPVQTLSLIGRSSEDIGGTSGRIERAQIVPAT